MNVLAKVRRVFVVKKPGFDVEARGLAKDLKENLGLADLKSVRVFNRYDVSGLDDDDFDRAIKNVFAEAPVDEIFLEEIDLQDACTVIAVEALPGQYDQRADSAAQCIQILTQGERPLCRTARVYAFHGRLDDREADLIRHWLINPVECREAATAKPVTLNDQLDMPAMIESVTGFIQLSNDELERIRLDAGLAMSLDDLHAVRDYFQAQQRDPSWTELRVLDTYWSDHCRHTTFLTRIKSVGFSGDPLSRHMQSVYEQYKQDRIELYQDRIDQKPVCLMDLATLAMKKMRDRGGLEDLDQSEEINACSIKVTIPVDGQDQDYLVMFKNETHNHPTEIEPFGGAATCLGGAIRDPLSGRSYVYQAMRVTGCGDPTVPVSQTLPGKLPQKKLTRTAANGYSSYGNQIGLATGQVEELYHPGYLAKRMEIGAVIAAAPANQVRREAPVPGDQIILLGGRTGRDGCGGATGSSKAHTEESLMTCGSEVQKGNPPTERKIQRLFRNPEVARLIKRCNDFGAGGVSVAIGELAPGLKIDLDRVPRKYEGLDGTELAISESQERMAVVVDPADVERFILAADVENLEAVVVAEVTSRPNMVMTWRGQTIVDLKRSFIDSNGAPQHTSVRVESVDMEKNYFAGADLHHVESTGFAALAESRLKSLDNCSRKGLVERFDSTIGAGTLLMPFGGRWQLTPENGMAALIPTQTGSTDACTFMTFGFDPYLSSWSPFHGAYYAVLHSLSKLAAMGADPMTARLTFQEYFERLTTVEKWGKPFAALLGAYQAQLDFGTPAIGGKDSMSGSFNDLHVPPTLVSFAVATGRSGLVCPSVLDKPGLQLWLLEVPQDTLALPDVCSWRNKLKLVHQLQSGKRIEAASTVGGSGVAVTAMQQCFGNKLGMEFDATCSIKDLFRPQPGAILLATSDIEATNTLHLAGSKRIGVTIVERVFRYGSDQIDLEQALSIWQSTLENVFPSNPKRNMDVHEQFADCSFAESSSVRSGPLPDCQSGESIKGKPAPAQFSSRIPRPRVFIPVFPGTNCEYDTSRVFEQAGAIADILVVRNLTPAAISETLQEMETRIAQSQIVMLPGGFSGGDEPEGSGKFIASAFRNPGVTEQIRRLLQQRQGLMLGICNGFQALIKLGLLPYGDICELTADSPTLTFNQIGRHVSCYVTTRIINNDSPWLRRTKLGDLQSVPVSHGEGRFVANPDILRNLAENRQIATQYVDWSGSPTDQIPFNPNGSVQAIEGIISPDGRIFGKMGHSERVGEHLAINIPGHKDQQIFSSGVSWFQ